MVSAFSILVVDSRAIVRSGLRQILSASGIAKRVDETSAIEDSESLLSKRFYDVVLIRFGSEHEIEMLARGVSVASNALARAKILLLGRDRDVRRAATLLQVGVAGYLSENSAPDELLAAVRSVASGCTYLSSALTALLTAERVPLPIRRDQSKALSSQESAVLNLLSHGLRATEIAQSLRISVRTVNTYKSRIIEKTGLRNKAEMIRFAIERGLDD